jgi:Ca2+-binding EF-hand superfamily protein
MSPNLTKEQKDDLRASFDLFDTDKSGTYSDA